MTVLQGVFLILGLTTLVSSILVVTAPRLIHSGLWLMLALAGVAGLFVLLESPFLAVVQVVIYIGAIAILIIFAIMLTRRFSESSRSQVNSLWAGALLVSLVLFAGLAFLLLQTASLSATPDPLPAETGVILQDLGRGLVDVDRFILPFEVASILLLAALVGAIYVARPLMAGEAEDDSG